MTHLEIKKNIIQKKVLAVIRLNENRHLLKVIESIMLGGVNSIEITLTIPKAIESIDLASKEFGDNITLGVGSVTSPENAIEAIDAGAEFVVSPIFKSSIIDAVHEKRKVVIPGCFTPTEIQSAYECGADFIKVFPADNLGMSFIKSVKAPLPHLNIIPTGGVTINNAKDWIKHGACAVGIGSALIDNEAVENENYMQLTNNAKALCNNLGII